MSDSLTRHTPVNGHKIHRHYLPVFKGKLPAIAAVRRFSAALSRHDWNRNPHIYNLRCERNQRVSVRSERRETWYALALAMIANADYNPDSEALFEVMCPVETLAAQCGQLHQYENGRKSYDPVLHALHDREAANLIIIHRDFDREAKQYKAMRIWLRPEFFAGLGFGLAALRDIVTRFRHCTASCCISVTSITCQTISPVSVRSDRLPGGFRAGFLPEMPCLYVPGRYFFTGG